MTEINGFLQTETGPLYVVCHQPSGEVRGHLIVVPPFAEEQKAARRALVESARALCLTGWQVWRPDLSGTGDSSGNLELQTLSSWTRDLLAVAAAARSHLPGVPMGWLGLRLGGALAWLAAAQTGADFMVLWEPVINGSTFLRQSRQRSGIRRQLTGGDNPTTATPTSDTWDYDGYLLGQEFQAELEKLDLAKHAPPACRQWQMLQISGGARLRPPLEALATRVQADLQQINCEPFWSSIGLVDPSPVIEATACWLNAHSSTRPVSALPAPPLKAEITFDDVQARAVQIQELRGVLYLPLEATDRGLVLLHGWSGYRGGPARLLTETAQRAARAGMAALCCDFRGRGDSGGAVEQAALRTMIEDARSLQSWMSTITGVQHLTLLGLCSGAEVALGASLAHPAVDSLVLWSAPVFAGEFTLGRQARRGRAALVVYWQKLWRRETWDKLLHGRLNLRMIARAISGRRSHEDAAVADKAPATNQQMEAFRRFGGRVLLVYGGADPETDPSRDFYAGFLKGTRIPHQFEEIPGANHNFFSSAWKQQLWDFTSHWLGAGR